MSNKKIKLTDNEICEKWLLNKNINPETLRKIKENKVVYKKLEKKYKHIKKFINYLFLILKE